MQNLEQQIKELRSKLELAKDELYRAELRLESLEREEQEILAECHKLEINPDKLPEQIAELEKEIEADLQKIETLLVNETV